MLQVTIGAYTRPAQKRPSISAWRTSEWEENRDQRERRSGDKIFPDHHFTRVHTWLATFLNLQIIFFLMSCSKRKTSNSYAHLIGKNSVCAHTRCVWLHLPNCSQPGFIQTYSGFPVQGQKSTMNISIPGLTPRLTDSPWPPTRTKRIG